jgi:hypothetical protein
MKEDFFTGMKGIKGDEEYFRRIKIIFAGMKR